MSVELGSLLEMAAVFGAAVVEVPLELHEALTKVAMRVEKRAKGEMGVYQPAVGPFAAWDELAESTKEERGRLGFTEDDPLYRSGELRDAITHEVEGPEALIGVKPGQAHSAYTPGGSTPDLGDVMEWMEFGTAKSPPRPVLGPAVLQEEAAIKKLVGAALIAGIVGRQQVHSALGYDFSVDD